MAHVKDSFISPEHSVLVLGGKPEAYFLARVGETFTPENLLWKSLGTGCVPQELSTLCVPFSATVCPDGARRLPVPRSPVVWLQCTVWEHLET